MTEGRDALRKAAQWLLFSKRATAPYEGLAGIKSVAFNLRQVAPKELVEMAGIGSNASNLRQAPMEETYQNNIHHHR